MIGTAALVAAVIFGLASALRLSPTPPAALGIVALVAALAAGALGFAHWSAIGDTRWAVGGALLIVAAGVGFIGSGRVPKIAALVIGDLGLLLFAIALATGYAVKAAG